MTIHTTWMPLAAIQRGAPAGAGTVWINRAVVYPMSVAMTLLTLASDLLGELLPGVAIHAMAVAPYPLLIGLACALMPRPQRQVLGAAPVWHRVARQGLIWCPVAMGDNAAYRRLAPLITSVITALDLLPPLAVLMGLVILPIVWLRFGRIIRGRAGAA